MSCGHNAAISQDKLFPALPYNNPPHGNAPRESGRARHLSSNFATAICKPLPLAALRNITVIRLLAAQER